MRIWLRLSLLVQWELTNGSLNPKISKKLRQKSSQISPFSGPTGRGQELNTNFSFSNLSGTPEISRQHPGISRQTVLFPWASKDIPNFLAPTPSRGRPMPHPKTSGPKNLGLGSFFFPGLGPFRGRSGPIPPHLTATEQRRNCPKKGQFGLMCAFWSSPRLLSPPRNGILRIFSLWKSRRKSLLDDGQITHLNCSPPNCNLIFFGLGGLAFPFFLHFPFL